MHDELSPTRKLPTPTAYAWIGQLSAMLHLYWISLRRLVRSRQTMVCVLLLGFTAMVVAAWSIGHDRSPAAFIEEVFLIVFVSFLLPIFSLCYGSAGIASDREEQTLVYLLVTPLPRPLIFAAKFAAALTPALAWNMLGLLLLCWLAGAPGTEAWHLLWPSVLWGATAYVALFVLFSAAFRRATIVALSYALFLETLIGNTPGIAKRLAISYYIRCLAFEAGEAVGVSPAGGNNPELFLAVSASTAQMVLLLLSGGLLLAGLILFSVREYSR
jgi:ABC-type transport system involved in multi-copper enzyme maturation permease subunit